MADEGSAPRKRGCLRWGCIGCISVVVLPPLIFAIVLGIGIAVQPDPQVERPRIAHELPAREPLRPDSPAGSAAELAEPGTVILDLALGEFEIVAGEAGTPVRVEAEFDSAIYELTEEFERVGELGWTYRVEFGRKGWLWHVDTAEDNRVRVVLPRGVPIVLQGRLGIGSSKLELGGLWLRETRLETGTGEFRILFSEPLEEPMTRFELFGSIGDSQVRDLGNASPAIVRTNQRIGDFRLDLGGAWQNDADVEVRCGVGACSVDLPRDVNVDVEDLSMMIGEIDALRDRGAEHQEGRPTIRLRAFSKLGELRVRR